MTIASDGTIYVGDNYRRVREIRDGVVSTLHTSLVDVNGLFLDESAGLLYVCVDHAIMTITVMTGTKIECQPAELRFSKFQ